MSWLLDVNLILASRWKTHLEHLRVKAWLASVGEFHTTPITELGFVRVSLSAAYRATWTEIQETLQRLHARPGFQFLADDLDGMAAAPTGSKDTTDAHLVTLAQRHGYKLATLDETLIRKPWASGIAENPLLSMNPAPTSG